MAAQVMVNKKKSSTDQMMQLLPIAGAVGAGIATGGASVPLSTTIGAMGTGAALGGAAQQGAQFLTQADGMSAVDRRMGGIQTPQLPDQQKVLDNARIALQSQPPEIQSQYMPMLNAASLKLRRETGVA
jgi:hypothetical protein